MMKKFALVLVALLVLPTVLTACDNDSADSAKDFVEAILNGDTEKARGHACESYRDATAGLIETNNALVGANAAVRNIDLKYDIGKAGNKEQVIVTGSFDVVRLNEQGRVVAGSEDEYILAATTRDRRDLNNNGNDLDNINTRLVLTMREEDGDWCVADAVGGYFAPHFALEGEEGEEVEPADDESSEEATGETTDEPAEDVTPEAEATSAN